MDPGPRSLVKILRTLHTCSGWNGGGRRQSLDRETPSQAASEDERSATAGYQAGHPAGFSPQIYAGEIHFCEPLYDPEALISPLKELILNYPPALQRALITGLWEAGFSLEVAQSSARRGDVYHATGCAYRSVVCMVQALFGLNERYWINEKGAVEEAEAFLRSPGDLGARVRRCLGEIGTGPEGLQRSLQELRLLLGDVERLVDGHDRR